jgi:predicted MFS family arabinose efflux permease
LARRGVLLLAAVCGVAVGNVYFPQAVSPSIAAGLHVRPAAAAGIVSATQLGYTLGLFTLVPLGDRVRHRRLIVSLLIITGCWLFTAAAAPGVGVLLAAATLVGVSTVVAPVIGPMAAGLVAEQRRGAVSGMLLSGSLGGMLLSRALGGPLSQWLGWRAGYLAMGVLTLACAALAARLLPATQPATGRSYPALLVQSVAALASEPELRRSSFYQATVFAAFSAVWTGVALLLTGPVYRLGTSAVGLLALVNAGTMVSTPQAGRWADRRGPDAVNVAAMLGVVCAAVVLAGGAAGGAGGLAALITGSLLLDVAMQAGMVANQVRNYRLRPEARSRVNTSYMTCAYCGGTIGSWLGAQAFGSFGWIGVCALAALLAGTALARHVLWLRHSRSRRREGNAGNPDKPAVAPQPSSQLPDRDRTQQLVRFSAGW